MPYKISILRGNKYFNLCTSSLVSIIFNLYVRISNMEYLCFHFYLILIMSVFFIDNFFVLKLFIPMFTCTFETCCYCIFIYYTCVTIKNDLCPTGNQNC